MREPLWRPGARTWTIVSALAVAVIQIGGGPTANAENGTRSLDLAGYALLVAGPIALLLRRRYRASVFVATLVIAAIFVGVGYGYGPIFLSVIVAFLSAATVVPRRRTYPVVLIGYLLLVWPAPAAYGWPVNGWRVLAVSAWLCVFVLVAEGIRQQKAIAEARRQRLEVAHRNELAQRQREEALREQRATEERLTIARELHDVLAHSLSMINVQSSVALELIERKPEQAASALIAIKAASRDALGEVHSLLNSIRGGSASAPTTPTTGIADIESLVQGARAAGSDVQVELGGPVEQLPAVVAVAAARIIQESVTNVVRHAFGASITVSVFCTADQLYVTINNSRSTVSTRIVTRSGGHGMIGMAERAKALGGELVAGHTAEGGFRVAARLPSKIG
ncbi:sensor histidine kinase [Nocardia coubleae]|uniref:sensor histidine kinase n=1 Tax=Nocardia coubleae TaxID=356147 RepID=UPI0008367586|nr:histidine kinase [Nocardia coubleae]